MTALLSACVAFQLNASMMSAVLPTMAKELNTDEVAVGLSQTSFFTSGAIFGVFLPRLSDIRGRRLVLSALMVFVVIGSALGALAPNIVVLDIARIIQGCSGPVVPPLVLAVASVLFALNEAGKLGPARWGMVAGLLVLGVLLLLAFYQPRHHLAAAAHAVRAGRLGRRAVRRPAGAAHRVPHGAAGRAGPQHRGARAAA
jgi:MFS family permease